MPLWAILLALTGIAYMLRDRTMAFAGMMLLADWAACTGIANLTGDQFIWPALAGIDYTAALLLMVILPSRLIGVLAISYVAEGMAHVAFGLSHRGAWARYEYWMVLHYVAWGQAWALALQGVITGGRRLCRADRRDSISAFHEGAVSAYSDGGTGR